jgi:hypothetical protein
MPAPAIVYAGAYVAGQFAGIAVGTTIARAVRRHRNPVRWSSSPSPLDMYKELNAIGFKY